MSQQHGESLSPSQMKRVDAFLDCIARLLAKQWLRDQRQQEEESPQKQRRSSEKE